MTEENKEKTELQLGQEELKKLREENSKLKEVVNEWYRSFCLLNLKYKRLYTQFQDLDNTYYKCSGNMWSEWEDYEDLHAVPDSWAKRKWVHQKDKGKFNLMNNKFMNNFKYQYDPDTDEEESSSSEDSESDSEQGLE